MPKKSVLNEELRARLVESLIKHKKSIYDEESGIIATPADCVWLEIAKDTGYEISPKYAYCILKLNRFNVWDELNILYSNAEKELKFDDSSEEHLTFEIVLTPDQWSKIFNPKLQVYRRKDGNNVIRNYSTLSPTMWTSAIHANVYEKIKVPCGISYKRAKIYPNGATFLDIIGKCNSCSSVFKAVMDSKPDEKSSAILECTYTGNFRKCDGGRKRQISGEKKSEFIDKLTKQNWSASYLQKNEANKLMTFGDKEPSLLPTTNALRILKHKISTEDHIHKDPILAVCLLKECLPYNSLIRDIGYDKFFIHYHSTCEVNMYRLYAKQNLIPRVVIDATGSVVKQITLLSGRQTHHIFLYQIGVMDYKNEIQFSVAHMLSECHDHISISHWLSSWLKSDIPSPKIVVTDHSLALMMACVRSFTQYSTLTKYLHVCSEFILNPEALPINLPKCMLRNDFNHSMHQLSTWPEMKSGSPRFKNFYMRAIALLICTEDFEDAKELFGNIFCVALNETEGLDKDGLLTPSEKSKLYLKQRIATHKTIDHEYEDESVDDDLQHLLMNQNETFDDSSYVTPFYVEICNIYNTCIEQSKVIEGDRDNAQYCPKLADRLKQYAKFYPCWGAIMNRFFKYGEITESSATAESLFNELKNQIFQHKNLPMRLDDFIQIHMDFIMGNNKILQNKYSETANHDIEGNDGNNEFRVTNKEIAIEESDKNQKIYEENECDANKEYSTFENWRGQGDFESKEKGKKSKKNSYLDKDPTVLHSKDGSKSKVPIIGILKNGNSTSLKPICIENINYTFMNTCAFDSFVQLMCTSYADSETFANFIKNNSSSFQFFKLIENMLRDGVTTQTYVKRGRILVDLFVKDGSTTNSVNQLIPVNCATTTCFLTDKLLRDFPSYSLTTLCLECEHSITEIGKPSITINLRNSEMVESLGNEIERYFSMKKKTHCSSCGASSCQTRYLPSEHLLVEPWLEIEHERDLTKRERRACLVTLRDIPKHFKIREKDFTLRGVISFIPPLSNNISAIGHYVTYAWRDSNAKFEKYYDLNSKFTNVRSRISVDSQFLFYTT